MERLDSELQLDMFRDYEVLHDQEIPILVSR